jgi:hypothetical protein
MLRKALPALAALTMVLVSGCERGTPFPVDLDQQRPPDLTLAIYDTFYLGSEDGGSSFYSITITRAGCKSGKFTTNFPGVGPIDLAELDEKLGVVAPLCSGSFDGSDGRCIFANLSFGVENDEVQEVFITSRLRGAQTDMIFLRYNEAMLNLPVTKDQLKATFGTPTQITRDPKALSKYHE